MSHEHTKPVSGFVYGDTAPPTGNLVLVVHCPSASELVVWMPRGITDSFTPGMRDSLIEAVTDFIKHVPVRRA